MKWILLKVVFSWWSALILVAMPRVEVWLTPLFWILCSFHITLSMIYDVFFLFGYPSFCKTESVGAKSSITGDWETSRMLYLVKHWLWRNICELSLLFFGLFLPNSMSQTFQHLYIKHPLNSPVIINFVTYMNSDCPSVLWWWTVTCGSFIVNDNSFF